jgi:hypothetical protein
MKRVICQLCVMSLIIGLCGCGGGGGSSAAVSSPAATSALQGVFQGSNSVGTAENVIVLEDGSFWNMYGTSTVSAFLVSGVADGSASTSNGSYTLTYTAFPALGSTPVSGTGSGTYTATTIAGSDTTGGQTTTINLAAPISSNYNYNTPAVLSAISGSWSGSLLDGETGSIVISSSGAISGTSSLGCSVTGTITPRPSGKNVFNVTLTFGASPCALPGQSTSGIALTYPLGNGTNQLIAGLVTPSQSKATAFFAVR